MKRICSLVVLCLVVACARVPVKGDKASDASRAGAQVSDEATTSGLSDDLLKEYDQELAGKGRSIGDPIRPWNDLWFHFNDKLFFWFVKPVSKAYGVILYPRFVRIGIQNFIYNLGFPGRFFNTSLQGRFKRTASELACFLINTTVGVAGFWDPATRWCHLETYPEDFDQTLGVWKIPMGIYLTWPFIGPSSLRGTVARMGDSVLDPIAGYWAVVLLNQINSASLGRTEYEALLDAALDPYVAVRDAYVQNRQKKIAE